MKYLHTALRVNDLDQAIAFYCATLGMIEMRRIKGRQRPCDLVFLAMPGDEEAQLELIYYHDKDYRQAGFGHVAYQVENIYDTCRELLDKGMKLTLPPRDGFMAFFESPDGIAFELLQKGGALPPTEPWVSMPDQGKW
jgi:lactoylglutathione lyase